MKDYLTFPITDRLKAYIHNRDRERSCGYPHPNHPGFMLTPILHPDRNARFEQGSSTFLWVEDGSWRSERWADEVTRGIRHRGWYVDNESQDEKARGIVLRIPGRNGNDTFLAGIADPFNYDEKHMSGPVMVCVDETFTDEADAARMADAHAESYAEDRREDAEKQREQQKAEDDAREAIERKNWEQRDVITTN